ncbi:MAG: hypothetical protein ACRDCY_22250, partial [Aeromonas veronii]
KLFPGGFRQAVQVAAPQDQVLKGHLGFLGDSICRLLCLFSRLTTRGQQLVGGAVRASGGSGGREKWRAPIKNASTREALSMGGYQAA